MSAKAFCVGNLTRDPSLRAVGSTSVVNFTVASSFTIKGRGDKPDREEVAFINCEAWDTAANNIVNNFKKGDAIIVSGRLRTDSWEDQEGKKRTSLTLRVEDFGKRTFGPKQNTEESEVDEAETVPF